MMAVLAVFGKRSQYMAQEYFFAVLIDVDIDVVVLFVVVKDLARVLDGDDGDDEAFVVGNDDGLMLAGTYNLR